MRIKTESLKVANKIWSKVRVNGIQYYEYVLLDFENKILAFKNENTFVKVAMELEDNEDEHRAMFVSGVKFFSLVQFYPYIDLEGDTFFSPNGDKFVIPELDEEVYFPDEEYDDWDEISVNFSTDFNKQLSLSQSYIETDPSSGYSTLFFKDSDIIACNPNKMFFGKSGAISSDFNIPVPLLRIICSLGIEGVVNFKTRKVGNSIMGEFEYLGVWIRYGSSSNFELPFDPKDEEFIASYNHPNYFVVNLSEFDGALKFLSSYLVDIPDAICSCVFNTEDSNNMFFKIMLNYSGITEYKIKLVECSDPSFFEDKSVSIYLSSLKSAVGVLSQYGVESIRISFDPEAPAMKFSDSKEECPVFVVHTITESI